MRRWLAPLLAFWLSAHAQAEPRVLRLGHLAPDGTAWSRVLQQAFGRIEQASHGELRFKVYAGGVLGDEDKLNQRVAAGQLDAVLSGGMLCNRVAPSMAVVALPGLIQTREEASEVINRLFPQLETEALSTGYAFLGTTPVGADVLFSRKPVHTFADLKRTRWWRWQLDDKGIAMAREMGLTVVPTALYDGLKASQEGKTDGFMALPTAALAFQWSTESRYLVDLPLGFLTGCALISSRVFDSLSPANRDILRAEMARLGRQFDEVGRQTDERLLNGLFQKQGLKVLPVSESLRSEYFAAARAARLRTGSKLFPQALIDRVLSILADYRAEHGAARATAHAN